MDENLDFYKQWRHNDETPWVRCSGDTSQLVFNKRVATRKAKSWNKIVFFFPSQEREKLLLVCASTIENVSYVEVSCVSCRLTSLIHCKRFQLNIVGVPGGAGRGDRRRPGQAPTSSADTPIRARLTSGCYVGCQSVRSSPTSSIHNVQCAWNFANILTEGPMEPLSHYPQHHKIFVGR